MNLVVLTAAIIMSATAAAHVYLGETPRLKPLRGAGQPKIIAAAANVVWHGISLTLVIMAAALFWLAGNENLALAVFVSLLCVGFAGLFIWYGVACLGSLRTMPQWVVFLIVPLLVLIGSG